MITELDREHAEMVLKTHYVGRLGCYADGRTYIVPITYVYEDGYVYGHTYEGQKIRMARENPELCFEVDDVKDLANWQSVIGWGTFEELQGEEAAKALDLLVSRLAALIAKQNGLASPDAVDMDDITEGLRLRATRGVAYRIKLRELTGRYERKPNVKRKNGKNGNLTTRVAG